MNATIEKMFTEAEGRYLEPTEQSKLTGYAETLEARLAAMRSIQQHEEAVVKAAVATMMEKHEKMIAQHKFLEEKATRDMTLVLRYCAMAMVRGDQSFLGTKLVHWFRTIIQAFEMGEAVDTAYGQLIVEAENHLEPDEFEMVKPYLTFVHQKLV